MAKYLGHRPSPSMVISVIALIVAMGGTGYAALSLPKNSVGSKQIKKNAVTASKIKKNAITGSKVKDGSLTGADLNAGTVGKVPAAGNADHAAAADNATNAGHAGSADNATNATNATNAAKAGNADTVGGLTVKKIFFREVNGSNNPSTILDLGGLQLVATCSTLPALSLIAKTTVNNADIHASPLGGAFDYSFANSDTNGDTFTDFQGGTSEQERDNFDVGSTLDVADDTHTGTDSMTGLVVYATPAGSTVTVQYMAEDGSAFGSPDTSDCLVAGTAIAG
jgi:hypothetical protein